MSEFTCGSHRFPAFSGLGEHVNKRMAVCKAGVGAIPPGAYFIIDRQSGSLPGTFRDAISGKRDWFFLLADDGKVDDVTICEKVIRATLEPLVCQAAADAVYKDRKPVFLNEKGVPLKQANSPKF